MVDVFISYARQDEKRATALKQLLDAEGWHVWWDQEIRIGKPWGEEIIGALDAAKAVVVLWTRSAVGSEWVLKEADHALINHKLFSVFIEECVVPTRFRLLEMAMLKGWSGASDDAELAQLFRSLTERVLPSRIDTVRPGYDRDFLGERQRIEWPKVHGVARPFHYLHFSVVMNPARRLAWYVAYNGNFLPKSALPERPARCMPDPSLFIEFQPGDQQFRRTGLDRGHLASFMTLAWGEPRDAWIAGRQAFFWTNTAPQHPDVNRVSYLSVEQWERAIGARYGRIVGFCGPVLRDSDPLFRDVQEGADGFVAFETFRVPMAFWKVIVVANDKGAIAQKAFRFENGLPDQAELRNQLRSKQARDPHSYTIDIAAIAEETGLVFPANLLAAPLLQ